VHDIKVNIVGVLRRVGFTPMPLSFQERRI
jgi:hypothetical protein